MRTLLATTVLALIGLAHTAPAAAQDRNWSGPYLGFHAGHGQGDWSGNMLYADATPGDGFDAGGKGIGTDGLILGGHAGWNMRAGSLVWGLEADFAGADIEGARRLLPYPGSAGSPAWDFESDIGWLATVRGRLGIANGPLLLYGTGGLAFAGLDSRLQVVSTGPENAGHSAFGSRGETRTGWTAGGGVEWAFAPLWSLKAEYLYVNLGSVGGILPGEQTTSCDPACPHTTDGFRGDLDVHTVRLGVSRQLD